VSATIAAMNPEAAPTANAQRGPAYSPTHPIIGPPIGVDPINATDHKDITLPRISGSDSNCKEENWFMKSCVTDQEAETIAEGILRRLNTTSTRGTTMTGKITMYLAGPQGIGKSILAEDLKLLLVRYGVKAVVSIQLDSDVRILREMESACVEWDEK